jgi:hypothetical protein
MRRKSAVGQKPLQVSREKPTFPQEERFKTMQNIRALFLGIAAITAVVVLTASITLAFAAMLTVFTAVRALTLRHKPVPVRAKASGAKNSAQAKDMRVWNDGRGTIIDL